MTFEGDQGRSEKVFEYLDYRKLPGCARGSISDQSIAIDIPKFEKDGKPLSGSIKNDLFTIEYALRCFVKIGSIFEVGQGNAIDFPLIIVSNPPTNVEQ